MNKISMKRGLWFHLPFEDQGVRHQIAVHLNPMTGKEVVYVDDHPASERRNLLATRSTHHIMINDSALTVELEETESFKGVYRANLKRLRTVICYDEKRLYSEKGALKSIALQLAASIVAGILLAGALYLAVQALYGGAA
ncbi:hypothetical protein ACFO4O_10145 [Glaciecola siphonariae]|uniref:Uncharacterized protein n=1 Tax=Glaciecola siphonariae TaxID=521012 RepID=A0ABV9LXE5_9ALTE